MKVRDQRVEPTKNVAWPNEEVGLTRERLRRSVRRCGFQYSRRSCPNCYNPSAFSPSRLDDTGNLRRQLRPFGVHDVVFKPFNLDRTKRAQSDMEQQINPGDAQGGQPIEELFGKVKASRRRSDGAEVLGIDGLVV